MSPEQFQQLLHILERLALGQEYTIAGAADWPILAGAVTLLGGLIAAMWTHLISSMKDHSIGAITDLDKHALENKESIQIIWNAMENCKGECCPPRRRPLD